MPNAELVRALTPGSLLLILVLLIVTGFIRGWIRTKVAIDEVRADRDARLADKDQQISEWREAHRVSEEAREVQGTALREALDTTRTTVELLQAFRSWAAAARDESGRQ